MGVNVILLEQLLASRHPQIRRTLVLGRNMPGINAGLRRNQLQVPIGKLFLKLIVRFDPLRKMDGNRANRCVFHLRCALVDKAMIQVN